MVAARLKPLHRTKTSRRVDVNRRRSGRLWVGRTVTPHTSVAALPRRTGLLIIGVLHGRPRGEAVDGVDAVDDVNWEKV